MDNNNKELNGTEKEKSIRPLDQELVNSECNKKLNLNLTKLEIDYLKYFLEITDKEGVGGLFKACYNKEFAMYPFRELIEKIIEGVESTDIT